MWEKWWLWWLRMTNAFILCNLLWKVEKTLAANREGSFKSLLQYIIKIDNSKSCNCMSIFGENYSHQNIFSTWKCEQMMVPVVHIKMAASMTKDNCTVCITASYIFIRPSQSVYMGVQHIIIFIYKVTYL